MFQGIYDGIKSKDVQTRAECIADSAESRLRSKKNETSKMMEALGKMKLSIYSQEINEFVTAFSKIKEIEVKNELLENKMKMQNIQFSAIEDMETSAVSATVALKNIAEGVGTGVLLGWGTYGGVMAIGVSSTGTAISGLSGAAATNATLAWLGGGSIAAGGGGIALGTAVLGGVIAVPALLITGSLMSAKGKESMNYARSNLSAAKKLESEAEVAMKELTLIQEKMYQIACILDKLTDTAKETNRELKKIVGKKNNWTEYTEAEKEKVFHSFQTIQLLKKIADIPLLSESGVLTEEVQDIQKYIN